MEILCFFLMKLVLHSHFRFQRQNPSFSPRLFQNARLGIWNYCIFDLSTSFSWISWRKLPLQHCGSGIQTETFLIKGLVGEEVEIFCKVSKQTEEIRLECWYIQIWLAKSKVRIHVTVSMNWRQQVYPFLRQLQIWLDLWARNNEKILILPFGNVIWVQREHLMNFYLCHLTKLGYRNTNNYHRSSKYSNTTVTPDVQKHSWSPFVKPLVVLTKQEFAVLLVAIFKGTGWCFWCQLTPQ